MSALLLQQGQGVAEGQNASPDSSMGEPLNGSVEVRGPRQSVRGARWACEPQCQRRINSASNFGRACEQRGKSLARFRRKQSYMRPPPGASLKQRESMSAPHWKASRSRDNILLANALPARNAVNRQRGEILSLCEMRQATLRPAPGVIALQNLVRSAAQSCAMVRTARCAQA